MSTNPGSSGDLSDEELRRLRRSERIRLHKLRLVSDILIAAPIVEVPIEEARHDLADDNGSDAHSDIIMADDDIPLNDSGRPGGDGLAPSIVRPAILADHFEIKSSIVNMIQNSVQFGGLEHEDPGRHIAAFLEVLATFKMTGISDDAIRLRLFPFSLRDKARTWLLSQPAGSITTWAELSQQFMQQYFPPEKTQKLRNRIMTFRQDDDESLYTAWERFKDLLLSCPHHELSKRHLVQTFYQGLGYASQERLDVYAGGDIGTKSPREAWSIIEKASLKSKSRQNDRSRSSSAKAGVHAVDNYTAISAQIAALATRFDNSQQHVAQSDCLCEQCGVSHEPGSCAQGVMYTGHEEVDYMGNQTRPQNNPYSNTYNPGWRNHPNFGWRSGTSNQNPLGFQQRAAAPQQSYQSQQPYQSNQQSYQSNQQPYQARGQSSQQRPNQYQNQGAGSSSQQHAPHGMSKLEEMMSQLLTNTSNTNQIAEQRYQQHEERFTNYEGEMRGQKASMQAIENQVGQMAKMMSERQQGGLPGNTEPNPRGHVNAIMTRSGKTTGPDTSGSPPITETVQAESSDEVHDR